jgi:hypothetical protein
VRYDSWVHLQDLFRPLGAKQRGQHQVSQVFLWAHKTKVTEKNEKSQVCQVV